MLSIIYLILPSISSHTNIFYSDWAQSRKCAWIMQNFPQWKIQNCLNEKTFNFNDPAWESTSMNMPISICQIHYRMKNSLSLNLQPINHKGYVQLQTICEITSIFPTTFLIQMCAKRFISFIFSWSCAKMKKL